MGTVRIQMAIKSFFNSEKSLFIEREKKEDEEINFDQDLHPSINRYRNIDRDICNM